MSPVERVVTALRVPADLHGEVGRVAGRCGRSLNATYVELLRLTLHGQCHADVSTALEEVFPVA